MPWFYFFRNGYFDGLKKALQKKIRLVSVLAPTGEVAAAGLFSSYQGVVQFHLAGTCEKYLDVAPTNLMFDFVRRLAKEEGARIFHLGGGQADALFQFKAGFSKERKDFCTFRLVLEPEKFEKLCLSLQGSNDANNPGDNFFSLYRKPLPQKFRTAATLG